MCLILLPLTTANIAPRDESSISHNPYLLCVANPFISKRSNTALREHHRKSVMGFDLFLCRCAHNDSFDSIFCNQNFLKVCIFLRVTTLDRERDII